MDLHITFDKKDRLYQFGEVISGKVLAKIGYEGVLSDVRITYQWRTHGRGTRGRGKEKMLTLAEGGSPSTALGWREFPFRFPAPDGPVTYHGHLLNVDWYLTAHAFNNAKGPLTCEEDFLLRADEKTGISVPSSSQGFMVVKDSKDSKSILSGRMKPLAWALILFIGVILYLILNDIHWNQALALLVGFGAPALIYLGALLFYRGAYRRNLIPGEMWVRPDRVRGGSDVCCHVDFTARRKFHLRSIKASLTCKESTTTDYGSQVVTETRILDQKTYIRPYEEDLTEGRKIAFDCILPVGINLPSSFSSGGNSLQWSVTLEAEFKAWPAWQKTFPIIKM